MEKNQSFPKMMPFMIYTSYNRIYIFMYIIYRCIYKMDSIYIYIEIIIKLGTTVMYWRVIPREPGGLKP